MLASTISVLRRRGLLVAMFALASYDSDLTPVVEDTAARSARSLSAVIPRNLARMTESRRTVFGQPTLTGEYTLDGNGILAFPLIGNVPADGSTTSELQQKIAAKLEPDYLVNPNVSVEIVTRRFFYVIGEVQKPGNYAYVTDMTALR